MDINKIILKTINSKASREEYEALELWKAESQQNIEFLQKMHMNSENTSDYKEFDEKRAWDKVEAAIDNPSTQSQSSNFSKVIYILLALALLAGAFYFINDGVTDSMDHIHESDNEMIHFALSDDSQIWLNSQSVVTELSDFTSKREVELKGEAYFDITRNPESPFTIMLNDNDYIKVLGTSFNVLNNGDDFDLVVYTGHVQLNVLDRTIDLYKNDRVTLLNGAYVKVKNSNKNTLSWKNKILIFDNEKMSTVFDELSDYYQVKFEGLEDLDVENCKLRSRFDNQTLESVLLELKDFFNIEYTLSGNVITLQSISCD